MPYVPFVAITLLEIEACIEGESSVGDRKICLGRSTGRIGSCEFSEVEAVDVHGSHVGSRWPCYKRPPRIVHHIDHIHADFKFLLFGNPDALDEIHVETGVCGSFNPGSAETSDRSRSRIRKNDIAVGIGKGLVAE